jgi:predicted PurR-regulated permease PerM
MSRSAEAEGPIGTSSVLLCRRNAGAREIRDMPPRSSLPFFSSSSDERTATLQGLLIATIVICALYFGREILLPLALAILLSFVLTRPLIWLRRLKVPRLLAVGIVVGFAFIIIGGLGWLLSREAADLAADLPRYQTTLSEKIKALRDSTASSPVLQRAGNVLSNLQNELSGSDDTTPTPAPEVGTPAQKPDDKPLEVVVKERELTPLEFYQSIAGTLLPPLATAGIVLLIVVFILLQREDLRDRLIRLFGSSDPQRATSTLTDAANRLSRYFLRQVMINSAYGTLVALALWAIGMPSPLAFGLLAGLMRFVPYVGVFIAAAPPLFVAAAVDPGWTTFLLVLAIYVAGEFTMGQVVEPVVFGHGTGVSPIAVVISTVFWTWLWGPLGLILAMPMTVVLAVLGRHVEGLEFFDVLLGDQPALKPEESFYHRALAGDAAEITYQAELGLKDQSLECYLDDVALPALRLAEHDLTRGSLDEEQTEKISATVKEMLDDLSGYEPRRWFAHLRRKPEHAKDEEAATGLASLEAAAEGDGDEESIKLIERSELAPGWVVDKPVLCIGARTPLDEAAGALFASILKKGGLGADALGPEMISPAHIASLAQTEAKLVVLSLLALGNGPAVIRYIVRRLRRILPKETEIMVCLWSEGEAPPSLKAVLEQAEADAYATSLPEAVKICIEFAKGERGKTEELPEPKAPLVPAANEIARASDAAAAAPVVSAAAASAAQAATQKNGRKRQPTPRKPQTEPA